jgi:hypothetical protein
MARRLVQWAVLLCLCGTGFSQKMTVKDDDNHMLMEVNDEGTMGSISLPDTNAALGSQANKLYNLNGSLIWNGNPLVSGRASIVDAGLRMVTTSGGMATVNFTADAFTTAPVHVAATAQFNSGGYAQSGRVTVSNILSASFDITVQSGSGSPYDGAVQVAWFAVQ